MEPLDTIGVSLKAKYRSRKRVGRKYVYTYGKESGKKPSGKKPSKKPKGSQGVTGPSDTKYAKKLGDFKEKIERKRNALHYEFDRLDDKFDEKIDDLDNERRVLQDKKDSIYSNLREKIKDLDDIEKGGEKILDNTGELGGAMEEIDKISDELER